MKTILIAAAAVATLAMSPATPARVADLGWLSGSWQTSGAGDWTDEQWSAPRAGLMLGASRSGKGDALGEFELLRIAAGDDGVPVYWASLNGKPPIAFRLASSTATSATFENPAHDYPQRIAYRREGAELVATISSLDGNRAISWRYRQAR